MKYQSAYTWFIALTLCMVGVNASAATGDKSALEVVEETATEIIHIIRSEQEMLKGEPNKVYELVDNLIVPHFDFTNMSKLVLGKNSWRQANDAQKQEFINQFKTLLVRTYAKALLEYSDQEVRYLSEETNPKNRLVVVKTEIAQPGGSAVKIDYRMHDRSGDWKVLDVAVAGISLVTTYRGEFTSLIRKNGIDNLIAMLAERNSQSLQ